VPELEVLVGELLTIDGLATGALNMSVMFLWSDHVYTYVATGEVTTLEHEVGDHTVELGAGVTKALLSGAESAEVLCSFGNDIVEELKVDATRLLYRTISIKLMWWNAK
jgi:hypothetical protein